MMRKFQLVRVRWLDSASHLGWQSHAEDHEVSTVESIGWLVKESKEQLTITHSFSDNRDVMDALSIPRGCILKVMKLKSFLEV